MRMKKYIVVVLAGLLGSLVATAQHKVVADKIVGIVGDKIILRSDILNGMNDAQRQGMQLPPDADCYVLEQQLIVKALVMQAQKDSVTVEDEEIEALLDNQVRYFISQYGSKEALEEIAGRTVYQIKEDLRPGFAEQKLAQRMQEKIVSNVRVTPQEVKAFFDADSKDSLRFYESELEIGEIVLYPKASREMEKMAMDELADFKQQVESGKARFESLASLYTDDPGSKNTGGQYNINRNQKDLDPAFINHAFRLKEGQISPVFKSKFGYHIIQMVSRAGDDAVVRHILRIPPVTQTEIDESVHKLDSVRAMLIAGTVGFGEAVSKYSEDENSKFTGGMLQSPSGGTSLTIDQLDKETTTALTTLKLGEYSKPVVYTDHTGKKAVRLIYLKSRTDPHRENLKDDYDRVAQRALNVKKENVLQKWFAEKIPTYYLMIDSDYNDCSVLNNWLQYAARSGN